MLTKLTVGIVTDLGQLWYNWMSSLEDFLLNLQVKTYLSSFLENCHYSSYFC